MTKDFDEYTTRLSISLNEIGMVRGEGGGGGGGEKGETKREEIIGNGIGGDRMSCCLRGKVAGNMGKGGATVVLAEGLVGQMS